MKRPSEKLSNSVEIPGELGFTFIEIMVTVIIAGILASVAIPSFIKHQRRAKTVEAVEGLDRLTKGARLYFQTDHYDSSGKLLPKQWPGHKHYTPSKTCCDSPSTPLCTPQPSDWEDPIWRALYFRITEPHYYRYHWTSKDTGPDATFEARAHGDLDCDKVEAIFKVLGSVDTKLHVSMTSPIVVNEIE
jgi:prepilin-type N-terminal cleavage/methylation domain-containing protein